MIIVSIVMASISLFLFFTSLFSLYLMIYTWEFPERLYASAAPSSYLAPHISFTVLLPARHEEAVIYETVKRVWAAYYPAHLMEIVVICHADDHGTIAEALRAVQEIGSRQIRVETFTDPPINKPHGLNVGLRGTSNQVVTIFDAEDDIDPNIFNMINTIMLKEGVGIVQGGVQLMNFGDRWFSIHNCLEYFFWFKSRLHFHAHVGMIPLGGNTIFIRRDLLEHIGGWDEQCLTEDAEIGLRLSVLGERIRVVYDAQHVTREETPDSLESFIKQRTRWQQGFIQVLRRGTWLALPEMRQRLLACYTLAFPYLQAALVVGTPFTLLETFFLKLPVPITLLGYFPSAVLCLQCVIYAIGAYAFAKEYKFHLSFFQLAQLLLTIIPFQFIIGISSLRGVYRELTKKTNWEKTRHVGAHRQPGQHIIAHVSGDYWSSSPVKIDG
jgi:cellulose synthase/poly-beta-1,6-N-acetylglucosamine synthase-like glycosyltransferase